MLSSRDDTLKVNGRITATLDLGDGKGERPITFTLHDLTLEYGTANNASAKAFGNVVPLRARRP
jgi:hypothetical protein